MLITDNKGMSTLSLQSVHGKKINLELEYVGDFSENGAAEVALTLPPQGGTVLIQEIDPNTLKSISTFYKMKLEGREVSIEDLKKLECVTLPFFAEPIELANVSLDGNALIVAGDDREHMITFIFQDGSTTSILEPSKMRVFPSIFQMPNQAGTTRFYDDVHASVVSSLEGKAEKAVPEYDMNNAGGANIMAGSLVYNIPIQLMRLIQPLILQDTDRDLFMACKNIMLSRLSGNEVELLKYPFHNPALASFNSCEYGSCETPRLNIFKGFSESSDRKKISTMIHEFAHARKAYVHPLNADSFQYFLSTLADDDSSNAKRSDAAFDQFMLRAAKSGITDPIHEFYAYLSGANFAHMLCKNEDIDAQKRCVYGLVKYAFDMVQRSADVINTTDPKPIIKWEIAGIVREILYDPILEPRTKSAACMSLAGFSGLSEETKEEVAKIFSIEMNETPPIMSAEECLHLEDLDKFK